MMSKQAVSSFLNLRVLQDVALKSLPVLVLAFSGPLLAQVPQGWPAEPLEMTPQAGVTKFQDGKLFTAWPFFSEEHIVAGTTAVSRFDGSGNRLLAGSLMVTWQDGEVTRLSRGAFVIRVSSDGKRIGQAYFGAIPYGEQEKDFAFEVLEVDQNSVTVGGWVRSAKAAGKVAIGKAGKAVKDTFLAELSTDLFTTYWTSIRPSMDAPEMTGESKALAISIIPIEPVPVVNETHPNDVQITNGFGASCDDSGFGLLDECVAKVAASDDEYVLVFASAQAGEEGGDLATFRFSYPIPQKMPKLTGIQFEVTNDECMTVSVSLGGGRAEDGKLFLLPSVSLCDGDGDGVDDPVISFDVPEELARVLGFWESWPGADLIAQVNVEIFGQEPACNTCLGGTAAGLDESTASSEIADP